MPKLMVLDMYEDGHVPEDVTHSPGQVTVMVAERAIASPSQAPCASLEGCCPGSGEHGAAPELVQFTAPRVKDNLML